MRALWTPGWRARSGGGPSGATFVADLDQVAAALRSGAVPEVAWRDAMGVVVVDGVPTMESLVARAGGDVAAARAVHAAAVLAAHAGLAPAVVLDVVAVSLTRAAEEAGQRAVALAGPRATAHLLAWLPALGIALGVVLGADPIGVLLDGGAGSVLLASGGALTALGRWWTGRHLRAAATAGEEP